VERHGTRRAARALPAVGAATCGRRRAERGRGPGEALPPRHQAGPCQLPAPPRLSPIFRLPPRRGGMHFGPARRALSLRESRGWRRCGVTPQGASAQRWSGRQILRCGRRSRARSSRPWTETASAGALNRARGKSTCTSPTKDSSKMTGASPAARVRPAQHGVVTPPLRNTCSASHRGSRRLSG